MERTIFGSIRLGYMVSPRSRNRTADTTHEQEAWWAMVMVKPKTWHRFTSLHANATHNPCVAPRPQLATCDHLRCLPLSLSLSVPVSVPVPVALSQPESAPSVPLLSASQLRQFISITSSSAPGSTGNIPLRASTSSDFSIVPLCSRSEERPRTQAQNESESRRRFLDRAWKCGQALTDVARYPESCCVTLG